MLNILALQKLDAPMTDEKFFGNSCTSSTSHCCNDKVSQ